MADRSGYDDFVAARSARLLRVAYLLTRDWNEAEDLLQTALMKAWFAWARLDGEPEAYVRKIIATRFCPGATLGISIGTVKSQTSRALARLRADSGVGGGAAVLRASTSNGGM